MEGEAQRPEWGWGSGISGSGGGGGRGGRGRAREESGGGSGGLGGAGGLGRPLACAQKEGELGAAAGQWSPHMGRFTKVNTLNSVMMEKHRNARV